MRTEDRKNMSLEIAALVEEARDGNRGSFQRLVNLFQEDIYRLAYYRTFSQMDAEDLTQDVFEQVYRKMNHLHDPRRFRAWLYRIAVNRCNDFLRKRKFFALLQKRSIEAGMDENISDSFSDRMEKKRFWQQVRSMVHELSAMEREVFTLRFMDHRDIKEIAEILDRNESTIKTYLYRALGKVRRHAEFFQDYRESIP